MKRSAKYTLKLPRVEGKSQTTRFSLAISIVEGNLIKVEEIVEAYIALYRGELN